MDVPLNVPLKRYKNKADLDQVINALRKAGLKWSDWIMAKEAGK